MRVFFDEADRISGFRLVPAQAATAVAPAKLEQGANWRESSSPRERADALPGTLTLPQGNGPFPAVVLVHGSGAHDRDETIGPNKPFRDLAHGLAGHGIAVLRYEKRTRVHPERFREQAFTVDDEVTFDAIAAVAALRARADIDATRVFVAGHSLGAMMAPRTPHAVRNWRNRPAGRRHARSRTWCRNSCATSPRSKASRLPRSKPRSRRSSSSGRW